MSLSAVSDRRRTASWAAWGLCGLTVGLLAVGLAMAMVASYLLVTGIGLAISAATMATVGALVVTRRPVTRSGWLLLASALSVTVAISLRQIAFFIGVYRGGDLGTTQVVISIGDVAFALVLFCLLLLFLTFPDGRLPSSRWRPVVALLSLVTAAGAIGAILSSDVVVDPEAYLTSTSFATPEGVEDAEPYEVLYAAIGALLLVLLVLTAASLLVRLRRARGVERQQLKWVVYAGVVALLLFPADMVASPSQPLSTALQLVGTLSMALIGMGFGLALFRYRLWDIDLVVRRSLAFAVLWLAIAGVYAGIAAGLGLAAGTRLPVAVAIGLTVLATLLFQPARLRLERLADRWVFGRRGSPLEAMQGFGELVGNAERLGDIATQLAATSSATVGLAWVEVDLDGSVPARLGTPNDEPATVFPVSRGDERFGKMVCRPHRGRRVTADDEALLAALAAQAGLATSHARLASRIVRAQEAERRRIERNIHDGAQQELVALTAQLGLARAQANGDGSSERVLATAQRDVKQILANLRELAQGIHPSVLSDGGLVAAVEDRCSTLPIEISLTVKPPLGAQRFSDDVEGAAYFFITEAITNVLKHSKSETVEVRLALNGDELTAEVADSGTGFDPDAARGSGLCGLTDRIHALGGEIAIDSQAGAGARLAARLPVASMSVRGS